MVATALADWARSGEQILQSSLAHPGALTLGLVFVGGLLTSLGPCSLSLLPVTLAYLAGFDNDIQRPWRRSLSFCAGISASLVLLGLVSGGLGRIYGQVPGLVPTLVALLAVLMGLNLLGLLPLQLPSGPDPERWRQRVPAALAPLAAGLAFGLAASPCTTPVLAVLLALAMLARIFDHYGHIAHRPDLILDGAGTLLKIGSKASSGSPGKYIWVISRVAKAGPK